MKSTSSIFVPGNEILLRGQCMMVLEVKRVWAYCFVPESREFWEIRKTCAAAISTGRSYNRLLKAIEDEYVRLRTGSVITVARRSYKVNGFARNGDIEVTPEIGTPIAQGDGLSVNYRVSRWAPWWLSKVPTECFVRE